MLDKQGPANQMTVGQLLAQVCRLTGGRLRVHMERIGLHKGQGFALIHLWRHDGIPQRDISRAMHISPASVTNMLQRMERDGWIKRERDPSDQRIVRAYVTDKAKSLRQQVNGVLREMEDELSSVYSDEEKATLHRLLLKLHDRFAPMDNHEHHHPPFFMQEDTKENKS